MQELEQAKLELESVKRQFEKYKEEFQREFLLELAELEVAAATASASASASASTSTSTLKVKAKERLTPLVPPNDTKPAKILKRQPVPETNLPSLPSSGSQNPDITRLYRKLCKRYHPDITGNDEDFLKVQKSYETGDDSQLITMALQGGIEVDDKLKHHAKPHTAQLPVLSVAEIKEEINNLKHTLPWVWGTASSDRRKLIRPNIVNTLKKGI